MNTNKITNILAMYEYLEELQTFYGVTTIEEVYEVLSEAIEVNQDTIH